MKKARYEMPRVCAICGRNGNDDPLDKHHVFGGYNRRLSERYGAVVYLCHNRCHENGPDAVHRNAAAKAALQAEWQERLMEENGWDVEDFRLVFGKSYIDEPRAAAEEEFGFCLEEAAG